MNSTVTKTLLAFLLALRELETPLSSDEQSVLQDVGQQLEIDSDDWDFIEEQLMAVIEANSALNRLYQYNRDKLDTLEGLLPLNLLPSPDDLVANFSARETKEVVTFSGQLKDISYTQVNQVVELASRILTNDQQDQAVKRLSFVLSPITDYLETYRFFNTYFGNPSDRTIIPPSEPLIHGQPYLLLIDISPERKGLDEEPTPFPDQALSQVWNDQEILILDVVITSKDFSINATVKPLTLPRRGSSDSVQFTVKPNLFEGWGYIRVELLYRGYLIQSKQIATLILPRAGVEIPESLRPPQTARITFTTTDLLTNEQLALLPERVLTVDVELDPRDSSIDFRFLDRTQGNQELAFYDTILQPAALGEAIAAVRRQLTLMASNDDAYKWKTQGDLELLNTWLPALANAGRLLYRAILPENKGNTLGEDQGETLRAALQTNTVIQVNPILGKVTIPWALLYERKIRYSQRVRVCEQFIERDIDCTGCPFKEDSKVVCPHAFWGYRYAIEQLPAWTSSELPQALALIRQIPNDHPLSLNFNVCREFLLWQEHLPKIEALGAVEMFQADEIPALELIWENDGATLDLIYFYCHGGVEESSKQPYLALSDERIYSNFLEDFEQKWQHHPLVFLNGCGTGDYGPESYISLIDDFRAAGASGVIGTECPVPEMFAEPYAIALLGRLFRGEPLGQAMLAVRRELLQKHLNPLGLVYSLYAAHEIALTVPVAHH